jgi:ribonuclease P protein component
MLPAAARMRRPTTFQRVVRTGRRAGRPLLTVHLATSPVSAAASVPEVGFVVSRKVGSAVVRNRLRRQMRHVVRDRLSSLHAAVPGAALVVRVAPAAVGASRDDLARDFDRAVQALVSPGRSS